MTRRMPTTVRVLVTLSIAFVAVALGDDFAIDWYTTDGGGEMWTTDGNYELSGTIGQPDAGAIPMTGGNYELVGGFWRVAAPPPWCLGDMNCSGGNVEFTDINYFVSALGCESCWYEYYRKAHGGANPPAGCDWYIGDYPGTPLGVEFQDINPFANSIGMPCQPYES